MMLKERKSYKNGGNKMCNTFAREIEYIFYIYISYLIWALKILNQ
jgi:hypothetical protein